MKQKIKNILFGSLLLSQLVLPFAASAAIVPCGGNENAAIQQLYQTNKPDAATTQQLLQNVQANSCHLSDLFKLIARITNILVGLAGIYAVVRIIIAGFTLVISGGNQELISAGKEGLTHAIIGFLLVMLAYLIVNFIFGFFAAKVNGTSGFLYNPFQ